MQVGKIVVAGAFAVLGVGFLAAPRADAAYIAYLSQDSANVVATGSGSLNVSNCSNFGGVPSAFVSANAAELVLGASAPFEACFITMSGPTSFGAGGFFPPDAATGSYVGLANIPGSAQIVLAQTYVSGAPLGTSTATWDNTTLAALGITDGTYVWTWGNGANADSFTLYAGVSPIPEPASLALLGSGLAALALQRRRKSGGAAQAAAAIADA
jgi:hypothetical protein